MRDNEREAKRLTISPVGETEAAPYEHGSLVAHHLVQDDEGFPLL